MQQDFNDSNDLSYLSSKNKQQLQFPSLGIANKELEQIRFYNQSVKIYQIYKKYLQTSIVKRLLCCLVSLRFRWIAKEYTNIQKEFNTKVNLSNQKKLEPQQVSQVKSHTLLIGMKEFIQLIREYNNFSVLKDQKLNGMNNNGRRKLILFLSLGLIILIMIQINIYLSNNTIPNKQFSYVNLPTELQQVQHHSFNSIQTSNMTDDFNLLCDIEEFTIIRNIRIFIQKFNHKFNGFMDLLLKIETNKNLEEQNIKYCYQTLCQELEHIFTSFNLKHQHSTDNKKYPLPLNTITQDKNEQLIFRIPKPTASLTTIISGSIQSNSKKQKKKIKQQQHLHYGSYILEQDYSFEQDKINQNDNESNIIYYDNCNDLISQMQNQLINNVSFQYSTNSENSLKKIQQKILTYEYMQYKLEQVGYPCISLKESKLIQILQDQQLNYQDKKMLIVKLFIAKKPKSFIILFQYSYFNYKQRNNQYKMLLVLVQYNN